MGNLNFNNRMRLKYDSSLCKSEKDYFQKGFDQLTLAALPEHFEEYFTEGPEVGV